MVDAVLTESRPALKEGKPLPPSSVTLTPDLDLEASSDLFPFWQHMLTLKDRQGSEVKVQDEVTDDTMSNVQGDCTRCEHDGRHIKTKASLNGCDKPSSLRRNMLTKSHSEHQLRLMLPSGSSIVEDREPSVKGLSSGDETVTNDGSTDCLLVDISRLSPVPPSAPSLGSKSVGTPSSETPSPRTPSPRTPSPGTPSQGTPSGTLFVKRHAAKQRSSGSVVLRRHNRGRTAPAGSLPHGSMPTCGVPHPLSMYQLKSSSLDRALPYRPQTVCGMVLGSTSGSQAGSPLAGSPLAGSPVVGSPLARKKRSLIERLSWPSLW